jgi:hypothetical protein
MLDYWKHKLMNSNKKCSTIQKCADQMWDDGSAAHSAGVKADHLAVRLDLHLAVHWVALRVEKLAGRMEVPWEKQLDEHILRTLRWSNSSKHR